MLRLFEIIPVFLPTEAEQNQDYFAAKTASRSDSEREG